MDIKTEMIEAFERGDCGYAESYEYVRERMAASYDDWHTRAKEAGYRNPFVAPYFCQTCHWNENAHPRAGCSTGFIAGDPEASRAHNRRIGWNI